MAAQGIAVTAVINILVCREGGGSLFMTAGNIGLCPPCIRATPLGGRYPSWWGGEGQEPCAGARAVNPPTGRDPEPSWRVGLLREPPAVNPPSGRA